MLIIRFTDSYGHQEELRFTEFETLSDYLAYHLKHHGFGDDERPSRWEELSYEELADMLGDEAADSWSDACAIAKRYGKAVWGCGPGIPAGWYTPQDLGEVLDRLWEYISQSWRDVEVIESQAA